MSSSNQTAAVGLCQTPEMLSRIANLTASYGDKGEELNMVSAPAVMSILIVLFLGGVFNVSAVLGPTYRSLLSSALTLSLPVMSYLFSEANKCSSSGLSLRGKAILTWMLLTELLRKKVDEIRPQGVHSGIMTRAGRVAWLGSHVSGAGQKAVFSILWILCATKLVQRVVFIMLWWRSQADKSWLISSYMAKMLRQSRHQEGGGEFVGLGPPELLLRSCKYIVMGEEKLVKKVTAAGYELRTNYTDDDYDSRGVITVGKVWELCQRLDPADASIIRSVCLSFALFKLLRGRYGFSAQWTNEEVYNCRNLLVKGLLSEDHRDDGGEMVLFQVMADEVKFMTEYVHSVVPVVIASPKFVVANYVLLPAAVLLLCLVALLLCGHGGMDYVLGRIVADNNALQPGLFLRAARCTLARAAHSRPAAFFALDLSVTALLLSILFLEEMWELLVVLISNWFMISLLHRYYQNWGRSKTGRALFRLTMWLRSKTTRYTTSIRLKQLSLLDHPCVSSLVSTSVPVSRSLKRAMVSYLLHLQQEEAGGRGGAARPLGILGWPDHIFYTGPPSWWPGLGGQQQCVTEVILAWHIATCLLEWRFPVSAAARRQRNAEEEADASSRNVAVSLSRYCAYLVVSHPDVLPDRRAKAVLVLEEAKKDLERVLWSWHYYCSPLPAARARKLLQFGIGWSRMMEMEMEGEQTAVQAGVMLARMLLQAMATQRCSWKLLADAWTELLVYAAAAASTDVEHLMGHSDMLKEGVELITVLWAFSKHTGISPVPAQSTSSDAEAI